MKARKTSSNANGTYPAGTNRRHNLEAAGVQIPRRSALLFLLLLLTVLRAPQVAFADLVLVSNRSQLPSNDSVDWGTLGEAGAYGVAIPTPSVTYSVQGVRISASLSSGTLLRVDQDPYGAIGAGGWDGDFQQGDHLLATLTGPITLQFGAPVAAVGAQMDGDFGAFTATIEAFDRAGNSLGSFSLNGNSTDQADGSAGFIGVQSDSANIVYVQFSESDGTIYSGELAINELSLWDTPGPSIVTQPASQTVCAGSTITFSVEAKGADPLSYQWQVNGADLADGPFVAGSQTSTLVLSNVQAGFNYTVVVTDAYGNSIASDIASLTVLSCNPTFTVTTASSPPQGGTTAGDGNYAVGTIATVAAAPLGCYHFVEWLVGGTVVSRSPVYSFTVKRNLSLVAKFSRTSYNINTRSYPAPGGATSGGGLKPCGTSVTLFAEPHAGYQFVSWTLGSSVVSRTPAYTFTPNGNGTFVANFQRIYTITTSSSPPGAGQTTGAGVYAQGSSVVVTAIPAPGYQFVEWKIGSHVLSTSPNYTLVAVRNLNLVAVFARAVVP